MVFAGSEYLARYAKKYNNKVTFIPTVIDTKKYDKVKKEKDVNKVFTVGWIGSPSTAK